MSLTRCFGQLRLYRRPYSTDISVSSRIIDSIKKLSVVNINQSSVNQSDHHPANQSDHHHVHQQTNHPANHVSIRSPINLQHLLVRNNIKLLPLNDSIVLKLKGSSSSLTANEYFQEVTKIGHLVINMIPIYLRIVGSDTTTNNTTTNNTTTDLIESLKSQIYTFHTPNAAHHISKALHLNQSISIKCHHIIGLNWLSNPYDCITNILSCIHDSSHHPISLDDTFHETLNILTSHMSQINGPNSNPPKVELNPKYLYYQQNDFQLPSIKDQSLLMGTVLIPSSIISNDNKPMKLKLDHYGALGNLIYKTLTKRALLTQGSINYLHLYYLFIGDNYLQFLLENIPIYNGVINKSILKKLSKSNNNDLYYRQFGQYFMTIFLKNPIEIQQWSDNHFKNYINIFNNLSEQELVDFLKLFKIFLNNQLTQIDLFRLKSMDKVIKSSIEFDGKADNLGLNDSGLNDSNSDYLVLLAKDYISYGSYKFGLVENFSQFNKQKSLILTTLNNPSYKPLLKSIGNDLQHGSNIQNEELIFQFLSKIAGRPYRPFKLSKLDLTELPKTDLDPIMTLALVNQNVSMSFFKHLSIKHYTQLSEFLKKFSLIGYSYYRFLITDKIYGKVSSSTLSPDMTSKLQQILLLKVFKAYVMDHSNLLMGDRLGLYYTKSMKSRIVNKYLMLRFSQVGFDQIIGALVLLNPLVVDNWINEVLIKLNTGELVKSGNVMVPLPVENFESKVIESDIQNVGIYVDKFDDMLQQYYDKIKTNS